MWIDLVAMEDGSLSNSATSEVPSDAAEVFGVAADDIVAANIKKNDSIRQRVTQVLASLQEKSTVLLIGKSVAISKLVTIVELVKAKYGTDLHQYNHISMEKSLSNPNYLGKKELTEEQKALEEVRGPKVYQLAILQVFLSEKDVELEGWNKQMGEK